MRRALAFILVWLLYAASAHAQIINGAYPNTFVNGTVIDATQVNSNFNYAQSQANANAAKNGTNSDITALTALATPLTPAQGGSNIYYAGTATGTANAIIVASPTPINFTLVAGKTIRFIAAATNTGATTLATGGTLATAVVRETPAGPTALSGGEIVAGMLVEAYYDGTQYHLVANPAENGGFGVLSALAAGATTDIGTIPSHNINLGCAAPVTITSFGVSASSTYPVYLVRNGCSFDITIQSGAGIAIDGGGNHILRANTGDIVMVQYYPSAGWFVTAWFQSNPRYTPTQANALTIKNNAVTPNTQIDITASEVVMDNISGGNYYTENYGTCTINLSVTGAGGLDTGVLAANTWYYLYGISSGSTTSCLASTSSTNPTMPAGYVFKVRLGAMSTDGASALYRTLQKGAVAQYTPTAGSNTTDIRLVNSGIAGTCSVTATVWAATTVQGVAGYTPSTAKAAQLTLFVGNNTGAAAGFSPGQVNYNHAPVGVGTAVTFGNTTAVGNFETSSVYYCSTQNTASLWLMGWTDTVNAN